MRNHIRYLPWYNSVAQVSTCNRKRSTRALFTSPASVANFYTFTVAKEIQIRMVTKAVIRRVMIENPRDSRDRLLTALECAYPFGEKEGAAREIWCQEVTELLRQSAA